LQEREELFASHREELRAQIAEGVAAEERGEFRDGAEAIADVRRRIDERLRRE
jgi:predicted transcriptional regulator